MEKYYKPVKFEKVVDLVEPDTGANEAKVMNIDVGLVDLYVGPTKPNEPVINMYTPKPEPKQLEMKVIKPNPRPKANITPVVKEHHIRKSLEAEVVI